MSLSARYTKQLEIGSSMPEVLSFQCQVLVVAATAPLTSAYASRPLNDRGESKRLPAR